MSDTADVLPATELPSIRLGSQPRLSTVTTLRLRNRSQVLSRIVLAARTTRATLARETGLSIASVSNIVTDLINEGLILETGSVSSQGGRPISLIERNPEGATLIGADIGERGVAVELFDLTMNRIDREFRGGRVDEDPATIGRDLTEAIAALQGRNPRQWTRLAGIGLGLPGIVETNPDGSQTLYAQSLGWPPVPVTDLVDTPVPVFAQNGAKAQAKAEQWFGAARGVDHAVIALLGRGVGLALITGGALQHGARGSAGEWGHLTVHRDGRPCRCGRRGCLEAYVGADAILGAWSEAGGQYEGTGWRAIGALLESSDPAARSILDDVIDTLGQALGGLVNLTNPQRIVIGGWVGLRLMEHHGDRIQAAIREHALDRPGHQFDLLPTTFGGDTVALGAATLPLESLIRQPRSA